MSRRIRIEGKHFVCTETGRILQLRGLSLGANSKIPMNLPSHTKDINAFFDRKNVSYVGRPFPLEDMHEHLSRIRDWGFKVVRLVVTWEALEHSGWKVYDHEYIAYLKKIVEALPQYDLMCIIDAHQDVFSRLTGGSGAPGWVLDCIGLDAKTLHSSYAAYLHPLDKSYGSPGPAVWPTGYQKLAASTCNTIFWAGDTFAYKCRAPDGSGRGLSTFLQEAMCSAFGVLADALEDCEAVLGFEPMNEPHRGYLELHSMYAFDSNTDLQLGYHTSALQSFALGDGHSQIVPFYKASFPQPTAVSHYEKINQEGERAWVTGQPCIWRDHGVWTWDDKTQTAIPLRQTYFESDPITGKPFHWYKDAWFPFLKQFRARIAGQNAKRSSWMTFAAGIPNEFTPEWPVEDQPHNFVSAPHFYDLHALFTKSFGNVTYNVQGLSRGMFPHKAIYLGREGARDNYALQLKNVIDASDKSTGRPCIIGEIGIPFDMNEFRWKEKEDYKWQERQLDALCTGLERSGANYVLWNYNPDNEDKHGDSWYGENFSLFSKTIQQKTGGNGGRCEDAFQRPYAIATAGEPLRTTFDMYTLRFTYSFKNPLAIEKKPSNWSDETSIYLPRRRYGSLLASGQACIAISDGSYTYNAESQSLTWKHSNDMPGYVHTLEVTVDNPEYWKAKPSDIDLSPDESVIIHSLLGVIFVLALLFAIYVAVYTEELDVAGQLIHRLVTLPLWALLLYTTLSLSTRVILCSAWFTASCYWNRRFSERMPSFWPLMYSLHGPLVILALLGSLHDNRRTAFLFFPETWRRQTRWTIYTALAGLSALTGIAVAFVKTSGLAFERTGSWLLVVWPELFMMVCALYGPYRERVRKFMGESSL